VYAPSGIAWEAALAAGSTIDAIVSYATQGEGELSCELGSTARVGAIEVNVHLAPETTPVVAATSLAPTGVTPSRMTWSYRNLVAARPLVLSLPANESPLGRAALLCRLAALAVAVFGLGFWYLAELRGAGSLDAFRWGHFLLLTSNHVLFFVAFAVLGLSLSPEIAFVLAATPSLALLTLHVARVTDRSFALTRALPLAALSFVVASAVAYVPAYRPLVALVVVVCSAAGVTVTWQRWSAGRAVHEAAQERKRARTVREYKLIKTFEALAEARAVGAVTVTSVDDALARSPAEGNARTRCIAAVSSLRRAVDEEPAVRAARVALVQAEDSAHADTVRALEARANTLLTSLEALTANTRAALDALSATPVRTEATKNMHCARCGVMVDAAHAHCHACGVAATERTPCPACDAVWMLPTHLLRGDHARRELHCAQCGARIRSALARTEHRIVEA
jgi:hypothetical protein